ncbi:PRTRC system protein C [Pedobacter frigoris]|uniref:PRTRC system protein C n=1 Tax=Pedobacter frigoris TaxID=2571272 RepID=UPI002930C624|nr:PRTRC system protein C [Pedobacter frigoris]
MLVKKLKRLFLLEEQNGKPIKLADPSEKLSVQAVQNFYSNTYPILTTAKIEGPQIVDDHIQYKFISVIGTKG